MGTSIPESISNLSVEQLRRMKARAGGPSAHAHLLAPLSDGPRPAVVPISSEQRGLWFLAQLGLVGPAYNLGSVYHIGGALDVPALEAALREIVRRHEILRTTFRTVAGEGAQVVAPPGSFALDVRDLSALPAAERAARRAAVADECLQRAFDLERDSLLRAVLVRVEPDEHSLIVVMHHIITDAWSNDIFARELGALYGAFHDGEGSPLPEPGAQYADYALWQRRWLRGDLLERQVRYWKERLAGIPEALNLPTDRPAAALPSFGGDVVPFALPAHVAAALGALAYREKTTLFTVLLAAFQAFLGRMSGTDDVVVGSPKSARAHRQTEGVMGYFLNPLVLRADLSGAPSFEELVRQVNGTVLAASEHQDVPFDRLVAELRPARQAGRQPLFQVQFTFQAAGEGELVLPGVSVRQEFPGARTAKFDLSLDLVKDGAGVRGGFEYATDLFERATIERFVQHFTALLEGIAENPCARVAELPLLSPAQQRQIVIGWNDTATGVRPDRCLHESFEAQAARTPDAVALEFEGRRLSYRELDLRANRLARRLRALGVGPETLVGICLERSFDMVVALFAVLKAGGAYVPLEPAYPRERLAHMIADAGLAALVTVSGLLERLGAPREPVVLLDRERDALLRYSSEPVASGARPADLAYVMYTSGSTGRPKGVMIDHAAVVNQLAWMQAAYRLDGSDRVLQKTPFGFDVSVWELFWPLLHGARMVLARPGGHQDAAYLVELVADRAVTRVAFVPSMLQAFLRQPGAERCASITDVFCAGETLSVDLQDQFFSLLDARLHNLYGPTETTVAVTRWACERGRDRSLVPIGKPAANVRLYVLDAHLAAVPIGVPGELYVGGAQVGRGYVHAPALTAASFVPDPYAPDSGARMYRTGDLVRFTGEGLVEFLGRTDTQVKVRGYRIELGEIESCLCEVEGIEQAIVIAGGSDLERRLTAWFVPSAGASPDAAAVQAHLSARLPQFMVPADVVAIPAFPLTASGKADRQALAAMEIGDSRLRVDYAAPRDALEDVVATILADLLSLDRVGMRDNFFQLGGHSLLAMQAVVRIREALDTNLSLLDFFAAPTLEQLVVRMRSLGGANETPIPRAPRERPLPASFAQERMWLLEQFRPGTSEYTIPVAWRVRGPLDYPALERSLNAIVRRHESLRTTFGEGDDLPLQVVAPGLHVRLEVHDLAGLENAAAETARLLDDEAKRPFDLAAGPLLRARVLGLAADEHVLALTLHHIVADGWSLGILTRELRSFYEAFSGGVPFAPPELPVQYADFAVWERAWLQGAVLEERIAYWQRYLQGAPPVLALPTDRPRPALPTHAGAALDFDLEPALSAALRRLSRDNSVTLFMTVAALFSVLLQRFSGQNDVCIGYPAANRTRRETEPLIGVFLNTLVLRSEVDPGSSFSSLLQQVRESALRGAAHQALPFQTLVRALRSPRNPGHTPVFQTWLAFDAPDAELELRGCSVSPIERDYEVARFDLSLFVSERADRLRCSFGYATDLFESSTVRRLAKQFRTLAAAAVADPKACIADLG